MNSDEAEQLCDALAELASKGPAQDARALVEAKGILRKITHAPEANAHVRARASDVERALTGWLDADERFHRVLKDYRKDIDALIDRLHSAMREATRFKAR